MSLKRPNATSRNRWFDDYIQLTLERDVRELSKAKRDAALPQILAKLAGRTAQVLNINQVASDLGLSEDLVRSHTRLLENMFLV